MNGLKYKLIKNVSLILPIFLLLGSISPEPFFTRKVEAAEVGMVGALPGSVTLWEIFQTIWAASGVIIANEEVQTAASNNFGSSSYTLEEMVAMGFTPVDGSNALDWDWSGLEDELQNSDSEDTKIIKGVFSQNGGTGSGGNNEDPDNDPWYRKAVNWVKSVVSEGKVNLENQLSNAQESVYLNLSNLGGMLSGYLGQFVTLGMPVNTSLPSTINANSKMFISNTCFNVNTGKEICSNFSQIAFDPNYIRLFYYYYNNPNHGRDDISLRVRIANRATTTQNCRNRQTYPNKPENVSLMSNAFNVDVSSKRVENLRTVASYGSSESDFNISGNGYEACLDDADAYQKAQAWLNSNVVIDVVNNISPDVITQSGNATVPNGSPSWVPTPYIDSGNHLEILPQPKIDEFTQYVTEEDPDPQQASEAWIDTVNPYVSTDPTPAPTTRPQPTVKPNVSPIPAGEPGSEDNPIFTSDPDPMPDIEGGFGTTFDLMDYFPFCIPSDLVAAFKVFEVSDDYRQAPYIDWNLKIERFGIDEHIVLDFSTFDSAAALFRILVFISFCISLAVLTKTLIWS